MTPANRLAGANFMKPWTGHSALKTHTENLLRKASWLRGTHNENSPWTKIATPWKKEESSVSASQNAFKHAWVLSLSLFMDFPWCSLPGGWKANFVQAMVSKFCRARKSDWIGTCLLLFRRLTRIYTESCEYMVVDRCRRRAATA